MLTTIPDIHMWFTLALVALAVIAYASERVSMELTSIAIIAVLLTFFYFMPLRDGSGQLVISPEKLLMGFANPALLTVLCLLVIGQALVQTGALNEVANLIIKGTGKRPFLAVSVTLIFVALVSAFLNNTPVVVIFIPVMALLAKALNLSASKVMMPISFVSILGGMTTLIGSSTNLLVSGIMKELGKGSLEFFEFTLPGMIIAAVGLVYVLIILPHLLPDRSSLSRNMADEDGNRQFIAQIEIDYSSDLVGQRVTGDVFTQLKDHSIRMIQRGEHAFLPPFDENLVVRPHDVMVIAASKKDLGTFFSQNAQTLERHFAKWGEESEEDKEFKSDIMMAEIVISPSSRLVGLTLEQSSFYHRYRCVVLGIERHSKAIRSKITEIRLAPGDVLLVMGKQEDIMALHESRDCLLMEWSTQEIHSGSKAGLTSLIFGLVVGVAAFDLMPIVVSSFIGVAAVIATGCINLRQASRAIDSNILLMIAASLALGTAMQYTGAAGFMAYGILSVMEGASPLLILTAFFMSMMALTNVLSNNAAAVLSTPIALGLADQLHVDPYIFVFAVVFACNCSFITPIGYQTNLMVMGPGHYKFKDFIVAGIPLAVLCCLTYILYAHLVLGL